MTTQQTELIVTATITIVTLLVTGPSSVNAQVKDNMKETISMWLTCELCDKMNGKYNITVGAPTLDSPDRKSIVVNGSVFDPDNTQMGVVPFQLNWILDDEIIDVMMIDENTGNVVYNSFDMNDSTVVSMKPPTSLDMKIK